MPCVYIVDAWRKISFSARLVQVIPVT